MMARIQRAIQCVLALAALLWAAYSASTGHVALGAFGLVVLLLIIPSLIAAEYALLLSCRAADSAPKASLAQLLHAGVRETWTNARTFLWRQAWQELAQPDHLPPDCAGKTGVLLLHGYFCNRGLWNDWTFNFRAEGVPYIALSLEPAFGSIDAYAAQIDAALTQLEKVCKSPPVIVAHSMGGLAARAWSVWPGRSAQASRCFTLGTPHRGTVAAHFSPALNARQMRPHSKWLENLEAREASLPPSQRVALRCFYSHCDNIAMPPSTGAMPGSESTHWPATGHLGLVDDPALQQRVALEITALNTR